MKRLYIISLIVICTFTSLLNAEPDNSHAERNQRLLTDFKSKVSFIYKSVAGEELEMLLFLPENPSDAKMPVMIHTHGGGWGGGDKFKIFEPPFLDSLRQLLDQGIACATIEYRLTRTGKSNAIDCVVDCKDAARFLMKHADDYGIDPNRIGVWGGSAGGHLALMTGLADNALFKGDESLATYDPTFRCIASYYPATDFQHTELFIGSNFEKPKRMIPIIGGLATEFPDRAKLLSPTEHLRQDSPPILLLHGDQDSILPIALSQYFMTVAAEKKSDVELITVIGAGHSFTGKDISPTMQEINQMATAFILKNLNH